MKNLWILLCIGFLTGCSVTSDDSKIEGSWILSESATSNRIESYETKAIITVLEFKADRSFVIASVSNQSGKWNIDTTSKMIIFYKNPQSAGNAEISSNKYEFLDYNKLKLTDPLDARNYSVYIRP